MIISTSVGVLATKFNSTFSIPIIFPEFLNDTLAFPVQSCVVETVILTFTSVSVASDISAALIVISGASSYFVDITGA